MTMLSYVCGDIIGEESKDTNKEISVNKDNAKEEISVNKNNNGNNIFPADLFNTDYNYELKDKETQESEQSLQSPRDGDQVDILKSKGMVGEEQADQDGSKGLKVRQESTQLDSPNKVGEDLTKSLKKRL